MGYQIDLDRTHQRKDSSSLFIKSLGSWEGAEEERRITTDFAGGQTLKRCVKLGVASLGRSPFVPPPPPQSFTVSFHLTATAKYLNVWPFCKYRIGIPHQGVFVSISSLPHPLWSGCAFTPLSRIRVPCGEGRTEGVQGRGENSEVGFEPRTLVSNFSFCLHVDCFFFFFPAPRSFLSGLPASIPASVGIHEVCGAPSVCTRSSSSPSRPSLLTSFVSVISPPPGPAGWMRFMGTPHSCRGLLPSQVTAGPSPLPT